MFLLPPILSIDPNPIIDGNRPLFLAIVANLVSRDPKCILHHVPDSEMRVTTLMLTSKRPHKASDNPWLSLQFGNIRTMKTILDGEIMRGHRPWDGAQPKISMHRGYRLMIGRDMGYEKEIETGTIISILLLSGNPRAR
jgi:hypothetical protein